MRRRGGGFSPSITGKVTIYPKYTDLATGNEIAVRCVLDGCFWNEDSISVFQKSGQQTGFSITLYIPYQEEITGRKYVTPDEWNNLDKEELVKYWAINPLDLPLMVKGENPHEFEWSNKDDRTDARLAKQELDFLVNNKGNVFRAVDVNNNFYGSERMWHTVVRC